MNISGGFFVPSAIPLRQRFDVDEEFEVAGLLDAELEADVDGRWRCLEARLLSAVGRTNSC